MPVFVRELSAVLIIPPAVILRFIPPDTQPIATFIRNTVFPNSWTENFHPAQTLFSEEEPSAVLPDLTSIPLSTHLRSIWGVASIARRKMHSMRSILLIRYSYFAQILYFASCHAYLFDQRLVTLAEWDRHSVSVLFDAPSGAWDEHLVEIVQ
jgi:hypothetical protein